MNWPISTEIKHYAGRDIGTPEEDHRHIAAVIRARPPAAIGKIGGTECRVLNYCERLVQVDWPRQLSWRRAGWQIYELSGVYPYGKETFYRFAEHFRSILGECDILAPWFNKGEERLIRKYAPQARLMSFPALSYPPFDPHPAWPAALEGKRVLLVSPFTESARQQHARLDQVWPNNPDMRPRYELLTLRTPLYSHLLKEPVYPDWFAGLEQLSAQMNAMDYDVALVGCGAWGLPLCVNARRQGKIGIHLGGVTQLFFGIRGKRWDEYPWLKSVYNDCWIRPSAEEAPQHVDRIESGCYW
ncbi:MAG TPA: hypothetical protein VHC95_09770 [Opitutales bacterium]|nr:hypothetical protein [Opitutales bacterium]